SGMSERIWACSSSAIAVCIAKFLGHHHAHGGAGAAAVSVGPTGPMARPHVLSPRGWRLSVCHIFTTDRETSGEQDLPVPLIQVRAQPRGQVGPARRGHPQCLVTPPPGDSTMIAREQYGRHLLPAPDR